MPFSLAHETSWATSSITTFLRSALTFQVRKRVAVNQSSSGNIFLMTFSLLPLSKLRTADKLVYCHETLHLEKEMVDAGWEPDAAR